MAAHIIFSNGMSLSGQELCSKLWRYVLAHAKPYTSFGSLQFVTSSMAMYKSSLIQCGQLKFWRGTTCLRLQKNIFDTCYTFVQEQTSFEFPVTVDLKECGSFFIFFAFLASFCCQIFKKYLREKARSHASNNTHSCKQCKTTLEFRNI